MKRLPVIPTLVVLAAVAVMIRLGFWQIDRMHEKDASLAQYGSAQANPVVAAWPGGGGTHLVRRQLSYRQVRGDCAEVLRMQSISGQNAKGEAGWRHIAHCRMREGYERGEIVLGWSRAAQGPVWSGGPVQGTFLLTGRYDARLVADPPLAGLEPNARPDPNDIPNNHWSYAIQWFLFAALALVIYGLALRKRLAAKGAEG